jgi:hypothetical protein
MSAQVGDGKYQIIRKLVEQVGGIPQPGDSLRDLLAKYLTAIGGTPVQGDTFYNLLVKVVDIKGGTPMPGDKEWDLLVKWLQAEGACRACGDAVHELWLKILALGAVEPVLPDPPFLSWINVKTFFISPTLAGGFLEIQHGPAADGPFTNYLTGIATPGADYTLDFSADGGEPGGSWYRGRVSTDQVHWSDWGSPAWDDNS